MQLPRLLKLKIRAHSVALAGLKLMIFLPQPLSAGIRLCPLCPAKAIQTIFKLHLFIYLGKIHVMVGVQSEDKVWELVLSVHLVSPGQ